MTATAERELDQRAALEAVCRGVADVLALSARTPDRIRVRLDGASVEMEWTPTAAVPPMAGGAVAAAEPEQAPELPAVTAPLVGTFYRAPEPGARPFVEVGDDVQPGQQIGIVEAMKLMNPVEADRAGRIAEILAGDAEPVEYGQPLVRIAPADGA